MDQNSLLLVVAGGMFVMMFFSSRKRKRQAAELADKIQVGAKVMLNSGIFGEIKAVEADHVVIESTPGTQLKVSRQAVVRFLNDQIETATVAEEAKPEAVAPVAKVAAKKAPAAKPAAPKTTAKPAAKPTAAKSPAKAPAKKPAAKSTK